MHKAQAVYGEFSEFINMLVDKPPKRREFAQTVTWVPTSTTRPVGIWKKSVASLAERASAMNR